jgi:hypothetical protein
MKSLLTLGIAAALLATVSIAGAQTATQNPAADIAPGNQGTNAAFCLKIYGAPAQCKFATVADCQHELAGGGGSCVPNAKTPTTTGAGDQGSGAMKK